MKMQISELAKLTGVSVRTLHYYDDIGLLKPVEIDERNNYRFYNEQSLEQLKQILYYKELNFSLKEIPELLTMKNAEQNASLLRQRRQLSEQRKQIEERIAAIDERLSERPKIHPWLDKVVTDYNYNGAVYSRQSNGKEYFAAWGKADEEKKLNFSADGTFAAGGLTKLFTAFCTLQLAEKGLLEVEAYIGKYLPEYVYGNQVKIEHLLRMTSGIRDIRMEHYKEAHQKYFEENKALDASGAKAAYYHHRFNMKYLKKRSDTELLAMINSVPLGFVPGEQYELIDLNYEIIELIIERVSGKPLEQLLKEYIWEPLGMEKTSLSAGKTDVIGYAEDYRVDFSWAEDGAKGLITTMADLSKWCEALLARKLLSSKGYEIFLKANQFDFACSLWKNGKKYRHEGWAGEVYSDIQINFEEDSYMLLVRNKAPIPADKNRIMYFPIENCDDGKIKLEVWNMQEHSEVGVFSVKLFDENAKEIYYAEAPKGEYLLAVRNDGPERNASEFVEEGSYCYEMDLNEVLGAAYDPAKRYIAEVKSYCSGIEAAMLGIVYQKNGEWDWEKPCYYVFYQFDVAYPIFEEALGFALQKTDLRKDEKEAL
ncbi:MAG: serine hydrolase [Lachnospiraceae bacterium]|nr:serine hydrolase [Lachnospiraceae bacterium]